VGGRLHHVTAALVAVVWTVGAVAIVRDTSSSRVNTADAVETSTTLGAPTTTTLRPTTTTTAPTTTVPPTTEPPTTVAPAPAYVAPVTEPPTTEPPTTQPPVAQGPPVAAGPWTYQPYTGLGMWVDVYDWSATYGGSAVGVADVDRMASLGVQTLYIQTGRADNPAPVLEEARLRSLINRAHADGMRVVGWFLPYLDDPTSDLNHLLAAAALPIDGLGVDIESRSVADVADRNQRILNISASLRAYLPGRVLSAIVLPPVIMEDINPNYWPSYPWAGLAPYYDVWQPMDYWTFRTGYWRSAYNYTAVDVDRVRAHIGNPNAVVSPIGGIGDQTTVQDVNDMLQAVIDRSCIGASLYDYRTTGDELWPALQGFRGG